LGKPHFDPRLASLVWQVQSELIEESDLTKAKMPVDTRQLVASDEAAWRQLWTAYLAFYGTTVPENVYKTTFERLLGDDPRDFSCQLAIVNDQPVGLVHYLFHRHGWKVEDVCYLQDLYTAPDERGLGVGRRLITAVYDAAKAHGTTSVYWLTQEGNTTARALYDQLATKTDFIKYNGAVE
jgi:GNAT superfamily N-acetyltransferase